MVQTLTVTHSTSSPPVEIGFDSTSSPPVDIGFDSTSSPPVEIGLSSSPVIAESFILIGYDIIRRDCRGAEECSAVRLLGHAEVSRSTKVPKSTEVPRITLLLDFFGHAEVPQCLEEAEKGSAVRFIQSSGGAEVYTVVPRCRGVLRGQIYSVMLRCRGAEECLPLGLFGHAKLSLLRHAEVSRSALRLGLFGYAEVPRSAPPFGLLGHAEVPRSSLWSGLLGHARCEGAEECSQLGLLSHAEGPRSVPLSRLLGHAKVPRR
ncbi:hypothetical protein NE237_032938 [Protea cynaroides]|uniref:Uncharacterized protein n=1 Tax=Protea cynaroides TaxID=273540 RepID=A0A9Q0L5P0_9MAGN|nr:hypothetical protein NE237_032938 [Protea cynaroides]